ncbi:hypothetical protein [Paenibacillus cremeus]|uniref:Uncharacterized protein n=1 Tax=Paenibacillus cremeus TaxID=2163881 RepID=A0A559JMG8_9BACL|nr:hypothetical protein [Paenibacillus cremeus]TVY01071.1 hypothetical protein FPZ49_32420 [Paenibacillus cremeus]
MVVYNYNEIPKELSVGHSYTLREIRLYMTVNKECIFLHADINAIDGESLQKVFIVSKDEYYIHQQTDRSYQIPYKKKTIYLLVDTLTN